MQRWQTVPPIQSCSRSPTESLLVFSPFHYIFSALPSTLRFFSVALAGLKLTLSLRTTLPPKCWGYRCGSPHPVYATLGGIQDFLILGQQPTQFNYSSTPPLKLQLYSHSMCVHACGSACGDQRTTVGAGPLLSPNVYQGPNLGCAVSIFIH